MSKKKGNSDTVHSNNTNNKNKNNNVIGNRSRLNSKDIPRTYSGLYGEGGDAGDLLPFELSRNLNTDWIQSGGKGLLMTYISVVALGQSFVWVILATLLEEHTRLAWTITHSIHGIATITYFHWIKGSPNFYEQGEMNAMTLWEQWECRPNAETHDASVKRVLLIVPSFLCYFACSAALFDPLVCIVNLLVWFLLHVLPKLNFMNGVRILGINRTTGIDDFNNTSDQQTASTTTSSQMKKEK